MIDLEGDEEGVSPGLDKVADKFILLEGNYFLVVVFPSSLVIADVGL